LAYQSWVWTPTTGQADGAALANSTTETAILPTPAIFTLPANYLLIGSHLRLYLAGRFSTTGTPTLRILLRYGAIPSGIILFDTTALTTASGVTNQTWEVWGNLTVRAIGNATSANLMYTGMQLGITSLTAPTAIPATAPAVSSGFDSTTATPFNVSATWGTANASNTITLHQYTLESLN
jgi:hypothetical protein